MTRYWNDWKPDEEPSFGRIAVYSEGVSVDSTSQLWTSCSMIRETRARFLKAGGRRSSRIASRAARIS